MIPSFFKSSTKKYADLPRFQETGQYFARIVKSVTKELSGFGPATFSDIEIVAAAPGSEFSPGDKASIACFHTGVAKYEDPTYHIIGCAAQGIPGPRSFEREDGESPLEFAKRAAESMGLSVKVPKDLDNDEAVGIITTRINKRVQEAYETIFPQESGENTELGGIFALEVMPRFQKTKTDEGWRPVLDDNGQKIRKTDKKGFKLVYFNAGDVSSYMDGSGDIRGEVVDAMTDNGWNFAV